MLRISSLTLVICLFAHLSWAQSTFSEVYNLLNTNCSNPSCHGSVSPAAGLDFSGSQNDVYQELVNVVPDNLNAAIIGDKLVDPGYPERSFLIRKLAHSGWDDYYKLDGSEGDQMPKNAAPMSPEDVELIRQWIYYGANFNTVDVDPAILNDFYNGNGKKKLKPVPAPDPADGFQIRLGSIFLAPQQEIEIDKKYSLNLSDDLEVTKIELSFNEESHHFILYSIGDPSSVEDGIRIFDGSEFGNLNNQTIAAWQDPNTIELPPTTAYFWEKDIVLDLNYHLINYDLDSVLAADVYLNIYTQPKGTAQQEMFTQLLPIDALSITTGIGESLVIPNDGQVYTFTDHIYNPFAGAFTNPVWHIWMLSSHTHAWGIDYDIYYRKPNGTKGDQLFEGYYNFDYTFNQGFYDWEHPPIRYFEAPLPVIDISQNGLIQEASYINPPTNPDTLYWGFTTKDEMMLIFIQYTNEPLATGIEDPQTTGPEFSIYPNPVSEVSVIDFSLKEKSQVSIELYNLLGDQIGVIHEGQLSNGSHRIHLDRELTRTPGVYFVRLLVNNKSATKRIISVE